MFPKYLLKEKPGTCYKSKAWVYNTNACISHPSFRPPSTYTLNGYTLQDFSLWDSIAYLAGNKASSVLFITG